jgi:P63C domain
MSARNIIEKFGGQSDLAGLIGKGQSTVAYWSKTGTVPAKWQPILLQLAVEKGLDLQPSDFLPPLKTDNLMPAESERIPKATHWGDLDVAGIHIPSYVLNTGDRVFSLKGVVVGLIGTQGGQLAEYLKVKPLQPHLPADLTPNESGEIPALFKFDTGGEGIAKYALGIRVERFNDLLRAYSSALVDHALSPHDNTKLSLTTKQLEIAQQAVKFQQACSDIGLVALVDEATGYQYEREVDALQMKLKLYLEEDMRKWEKTYPDQLWAEFGRLTNWKGTLHQRPKYWGKLIMELVYGYLDPDVAKWLKEHAPKPMHGQNYHQWLSSQFGLKKLTEHIWLLVGMAAACQSMQELRQKMAERFGRHQVQLTLYLPINN